VHAEDHLGRGERSGRERGEKNGGGEERAHAPANVAPNAAES
jgi:hypothetical protein